MNQAYKLDLAAQALVGSTSRNLSQKISHQNSVFYFNRQQSKNPTKPWQNKLGTGGSSLYRVDMPSDANHGFTFYDANTHLKFSLIPNFSSRPSKLRRGHLVYPLGSGAQAIYTVKGNGLKEDIFYNEAPNDGVAKYTYTLKLPKTLEARQMSDGSVGIYSASPVLYGNVKYGNNTDRVRLMEARQSEPKNHLVFGLPAPKIITLNQQCIEKNKELVGPSGQNQATWQKAGTLLKQIFGSNPKESPTFNPKQGCTQQAAMARASFALEGGSLVLRANNLDSIKGAFSIDPSVVVTSSSDFSAGNNEGMIDWSGNQLSRANLSGGTVGTWTSAGNNLPSPRDHSGTATYNGYTYLVGGNDGSYLNTVLYAKLNPDGTIGAWIPADSLLPTARDNVGAVAYNGYVYAVGGHGSGVRYADTLYAKIQSDGSLGPWQDANTGLPSGRGQVIVAAYNGYLYAFGGYDGTSALTDTLYAKVNADGTLGTWQSTTVLPAPSSNRSGAVFNGKLYLVGTQGGAVYYATINSDGSVGTWQTATSLPTDRKGQRSLVANGYLYSIGGYSGTTQYADVLYAPIYANGSLGQWRYSTPLPTAGFCQTIAYGGYIYCSGGSDGTNQLASVISAKISSAGIITDYQMTTAVGASSPSRTGAGLVTYNGCIYSFGGVSGATYSAQVYYAQLNADGTIGAWSAGSSTMLNAVADFGFAVSDGRLYVIGGQTSSGYIDTIQFTSFSSTGCGVGSWQNNISNYGHGTVGNQPAASYAGYIYMVGDNGGGASADVYYAKVNANGSLGGFLPTNENLITARAGESMVAYGGYLYVAGGAATSVEYASINADGTIGAWQASTSLSQVRSQFGLIAHSGYLYALGGLSGGADTATTEYAPINTDGSLGTWTYNTALGDTHRGPAAVSGNKFYMASGMVSGSASTDAFVMTINNGGPGSVTPWQTQTNTFATARQAHCSVVNNGYIYVIGGLDSNDNGLTDVQYAPLGLSGTVGAWQSATALPVAKSYLGCVAYNSRLYVVGGQGGGQAGGQAVKFIDINADGSLGTTWQTANNLLSARYGHTTFQHNGYMYTVGGAVNAPTYFYGFEDGTLAPFTTSGYSNWAVTTADANTGTYSVDSGNIDTGSGGTNQIVLTHMYNNGGYISFARKTLVNNANANVQFQFYIDGVLQTTWTNTADWQSFVYSVTPGAHTFTWEFSTASNAQGSKMWLDDINLQDGGASQSVFSDGFEDNTLPPFTTSGNANWLTTNSDANTGTYSARSGVIGDAQTTNMSLTFNMLKSGSITFSRRVSSQSDSSGADYFRFYIDGVMVAQAAGELPWQSFSYSVPSGNHTFMWQYVKDGKKLLGSDAVWVDDVSIDYISKVYSSSETLYAPINSVDGTLGTWQQTTSVPGGRYAHSSVVYNNYVYVIGGVDDSNRLTSSVLYAPLNSDGTVGTWQPTASLPEPRAYQSSVVFNGFVYVFGGNTGSDTANTLYAPINANGTLGNWQPAKSLPSAVFSGAAVESGADVYITGGSSSGTPANTTYSATLESIPRIGHYSKLITLPTNASKLMQLTYTGDLPGGDGSISYQIAKDDGILSSPGSVQTLNTTNTPSPSGLECEATSLDGTLYVWVSAVLDDSGRAVFPDVSGSHATIDDVTATFDVLRLQAPPNQRLRGGAFFATTTGILRPLDTCKPTHA